MGLMFRRWRLVKPRPDLVTADVAAWSANVFATSSDEMLIEPTGRRLQQ